MGTTPVYGLPYPEPTDLVKDGASAVQSLAEAIDERFTAMYASGFFTAEQALANNVSTAVLFTSDARSSVDHFDYDPATGIFGYIGPGPRLFLIAAHAVVAVNGTTPLGVLTIDVNGATAAVARHDTGYATLGASIVELLNPGASVKLAALANDGSGGLGGGVSDGRLQIVTL